MVPKYVCAAAMCAAVLVCSGGPAASDELQVVRIHCPNSRKNATERCLVLFCNFLPTIRCKS